MELVDIAKKYLGTPYQWGAIGPNCFDCSGLVQTCLKEYGITMPPMKINSQALQDLLIKLGGATKLEVSTNNILFFGETKSSITHCSIALNRYCHIHMAHGDSSVRTLNQAIEKRAFCSCESILFRKGLQTILSVSTIRE
jgi:cell wall-associated NlpC family hydrolase